MPDIDLRPMICLAVIGLGFLIPTGCGALAALIAAPFALYNHDFGMIVDANSTGACIGVVLDLVIAGVWGLDRAGML